MKYDERIKLYRDALKQWGVEAQCHMGIEEAAELLVEVSSIVGKLTKALCKVWRVKDGISYNKAKMLLQYEIADMDIMVEQLKVIFGTSEIEKCKNEKLERLKGMLYK
jgi:hypothetical protein